MKISFLKKSQSKIRKTKKLNANIKSEEKKETANFSMNKMLFLLIKKCSEMIKTTLITSMKERLQCPT